VVEAGRVRVKAQPGILDYARFAADRLDLRRDIEVGVTVTGRPATRAALPGGAGYRLRDKWADGPKTWLGLGLAGFPNLFTVTGPGSLSVPTAMFTSTEQQVDWIAALIARQVTEASLFMKGRSWYLRATIRASPGHSAVRGGANRCVSWWHPRAIRAAHRRGRCGPEAVRRAGSASAARPVPVLAGDAT
jgi:hypothetical protein